MYRFIVSRRYVNLLFMLGGSKNIQQLSRDSKINMTISHLSNVTDQFVKEKLITKQKSGRETELKLTEKGKELVELMRKYDELANPKLDKKEEE